ncbi:GNAT family N-acetyltransferase [Lactococcus lactis]|uniref:GNAT family N-acetyltransferase n=1 Tax=Lactococcus lactis TaxID=1358 RepID=UPI002418ADE8|nr:GNAT family N-acetyltransferase [Lactococcus lactis]MDG4966812.1 GNAT family N-acetyltransferase [Lactococcus lactis]
MNYININIEENKKAIIDELNQVTRERSPESSLCPEEYISIALEDNGEVVARLVGLIFFNILHVELFSANNKYRGKGYGTKLFNYAENLAKKKGCHSIFLETLSFYAPRFYKERDFQIIRQISDSPVKGETHYFMLKLLKE